uniref:Tubulin-specific chaperone D n=1 Tax=Acrobeloides nanus TaxID=290746 RepID=A0A914CJN7_9BILA
MEKELSKLTIAALIRLKVLTTVRGYKTIIKLLPHEVAYLEKLLITLEFYVALAKDSAYPKQCINQEALYILIVWLLIICKNPFNLAMFDSAKSRADGAKTTVQRILECLQVFRKWYAVDLRMVVLIVTRNEDNTVVLKPIIDNSLETLKKSPMEEREVLKELQLLVAIFKRGKRAEMLKYAKPVLDHLSLLLKLDSPNTHIRNFTVKLVQRLVVVFLKPRLAKWRYLCGVRSLEQNLKQPTSSSKGTSQELKEGLEEEWYTPSSSDLVEQEEEEDGEEDDDIPYEEVETGIGCILMSICDKENDVRWSGAKGIGRICARLPKSLGDMVISQVLLQNFKEYAPAGAWHGGCLALAELARRGCLLPKRLPEVLEVLEKALRFNETHGNFSASVNVRDAACYICWAFARAYETKIMAPYMKAIAKCLICVALFDREVNVRRAASAAFQENVGRHGKIPRGIEINTILDFVAVGIRKRCYLDLCVKLAELQVPEVASAMIDFLTDFQTVHFDEKIRILASEALKKLARFEIDYVIEKVIPRIYSRVSSPYPDYKHGSLFALAGLLEGLFEAKLHDDSQMVFQNPGVEKLILVVSEIYPSIISKRTTGVSLFMNGLCRYIQAMAYVKVKLTNEQLQEWTDVLDLIACEDSIVYHQMVQNAYRPLMEYYKENYELLIKRIKEKYFDKLQNRDREWDRVGAILPLSCIPKEILEYQVTFDNTSYKLLAIQIIECLLSCIPKEILEYQVTFDNTSYKLLAIQIIECLIGVILDQSNPMWTDARVTAINTMTSILSVMWVEHFEWKRIFECLLHSLDDYTKNECGDIGSFVRRASISAFGILLPKFYESKNEKKIEGILDLAIQKILKQCCEIMDTVRNHAAVVMSSLLTHEHIPIKHKNLLATVFERNPDDTDEDFKKAWLFEGFSRMEPLFDLEIYRRFVLMGFVFCAGNLIQSSNRSAYMVLKHHTKSIKDNFEKTEQLLEDLHKIFVEIMANKESQLVFLNLMQMFFNERTFIKIEETPDESPGFKNIVDLIINIATSKGAPKVKSMALSTLGSFLQVNATSKIWYRVLMVMISFLNSKYPALRTRSAEHLYEALSASDESEYNSDEMQQVFALLSETSWALTGSENEANLNKVTMEIGTTLKKLYGPKT